MAVVETDFWKEILKNNINEFFKETNFLLQKILDNFDSEIKKFKQVCPIEMLDKLENPISFKSVAKRQVNE